MIDTSKLRKDCKALAKNWIKFSHSDFNPQDGVKAADELDRLYLDTAPLSREELEDELREAGWNIFESLWTNGEMWKKSKEANGCMIITNGKLWTDDFKVPLSAVTRRLLRDCGVIA